MAVATEPRVSSAPQTDSIEPTSALSIPKITRDPVERRIFVILALGVLLLVGSLFLRMRVTQFMGRLYPNYNVSKWAPFIQSYKELAWGGCIAGVSFSFLGVHHWLNYSVQSALREERRNQRVACRNKRATS
ncbi:MAG: hypothetical protein KDA92_19640 [Planctomycetales bacterium]|nr:hypothetical protein [Planctomycetales bacterium]